MIRLIFCLVFLVFFSTDVIAQMQRHVVQRGETIESIAQKYGITEQELRQRNPALDDAFYVAMTLTIPKKDEKTTNNESEIRNKRGYVATTVENHSFISEESFLNLNQKASALYRKGKYEEAVAIGDECLTMLVALFGTNNKTYYEQCLNQATYLYAIDKFPECIMYESRAIDLANKLKFPVSYDRLKMMSKRADEIGARLTPSKWELNLKNIFDICVAQSSLTPDDVDNYKNYKSKYDELKTKGKEDTEETLLVLNKLIPLTLSVGETLEAFDYIYTSGPKTCELYGTYSIKNAWNLLYYAMGIIQDHANDAIDTGESILEAKYRSNGVMEVLDSCGVKDCELRVRALMTRSYAFSHQGVAGNALNDAEEAVMMAKRIKGENSELYDYAYYYFMQVKLRFNKDTCECIDNLKNIYEWRKKHYGNNHAETITVLLALAHFLSEKGKYDEAEKFFTLFYDAQTYFIASCFSKMSPEQQKRFWLHYSYYYQQVIPQTIIRRLQESGEKCKVSSVAYNSQLLSKGMSMYVQTRPITHDLTLKWKDIQRHLKEGEIAVEFVHNEINTPMHTWYYDKDQLYCVDTGIDYDNIYSAVVISRSSSEPLFINLFSSNDMGRLFVNGQIRQQLLSERIWKPIIEKFPNTKCIFFSPVAELYELPLESFPYYNGEGLMSDRFSMHRLTSTRELTIKHNSNKNSNGSFYGGVDYDSGINVQGGSRGAEVGIPYLVGTEKEVIAVEEIIKKTSSASMINTFMHNRASEEVLKHHSYNSESILHIATHGFYNAICDLELEGTALQRSGLLMAGAANNISSKILKEDNDGILTSEEIAHLDLSKLDIAVLSACDTAIGDVTGEGVEGLQLGFKLAGVNTLLMSLWKVDDEATCKLMTEFYSNWIGKKMTKHDALEAAKKTVRETKGWENPKYWAAFILLDGLD